jgi:hypothetical protein
MLHVERVAILMLVGVLSSCRQDVKDSGGAVKLERASQAATQPRTQPATHSVSKPKTQTVTTTSTRPPRSDELLEESYALSNTLKGSPLERDEYLLELCRISSEVNSRHAQEWCMECFNHAKSTEISGCARDRLQAYALKALSNVNPQLAMTLLGQMPGPSPCASSDEEDIGRAQTESPR